MRFPVVRLGLCQATSNCRACLQYCAMRPTHLNRLGFAKIFLRESCHSRESQSASLSQFLPVQMVNAGEPCS
jgi:hypothetical protein